MTYHATILTTKKKIAHLQPQTRAQNPRTRALATTLAAQGATRRRQRIAQRPAPGYGATANLLVQSITAGLATRPVGAAAGAAVVREGMVPSTKGARGTPSIRGLRGLGVGVVLRLVLGPLVRNLRCLVESEGGGGCGEGEEEACGGGGGGGV